MANRLIGIDISPGSVHVAVLGQHRGTATLVALRQQPCEQAGEAAGLLATMVPGGVQPGDRVATALPAGEAFVRTLHFPFRERRKILAAAPFALADQLPVAMDEYLTVLLAPREDAEGGSRVVAAAVPRQAIDTRLTPFDQNRIPLQFLDLMPFALGGGIGDAIGTGQLICIDTGAAIVASLEGGLVVDHRHFPLGGEPLPTESLARLLHDAVTVLKRNGGDYPRVCLTGSLASPELCEQLRSLGVPAELFTLPLGHQQIPPAFVPAVSLALRAGGGAESRSFNLRQGGYAYHGESAALRKTLFALGGLFLASLLLFALATGLAYQDKRRQAEDLLARMSQQYRETFPGSTITVDVPLQMQSKVQELRNRAAALGIGSQPQSLPILKELSAATARTPFEIEELACDQESCVLAGSTASFEAVDRIKEQLGAGTLFGRVEVAETRKGVDGSRVEFRLRLALIAKGGG